MEPVYHVNDFENTTLTMFPSYNTIRKRVRFVDTTNYDEKPKEGKIVFPKKEMAERISHTRAVLVMGNYKVVDKLSMDLMMSLSLILVLGLLMIMAQHSGHEMAGPRLSNPQGYWMSKYIHILNGTTNQTFFC